jgi:hypothetical protein
MESVGSQENRQKYPFPSFAPHVIEQLWLKRKRLEKVSEKCALFH